MKKMLLAGCVVLSARAMNEQGPYDAARALRSVVIRGDAQKIGLFFIEQGYKNINEPIGDDQNNILAYAGSPEAFMFLVGVGANVDARNRYGETVFDHLSYREENGWIKKGTLKAAQQWVRDRDLMREMHEAHIRKAQ